MKHTFRVSLFLERIFVMKTIRIVRFLIVAAFIVAAVCIVIRSPEKAPSPIETSSSKNVGKNAVATKLQGSDRVQLSYSLDSSISTSVSNENVSNK